MAVPAANYGKSSDYGALVADAARSARLARQKIMDTHALLDYGRDDVSEDVKEVGLFLADKLGVPTTFDGEDLSDAERKAEAQKIWDEMSSMLGYVSSTSANTFGAAALQLCAKLGV